MATPSAAIGSKPFIKNYVEEKVTQWVNEVNQLATIAATHPQVSYAAFTHGFINKWTYFANHSPPNQLPTTFGGRYQTASHSCHHW